MIVDQSITSEHARLFREEGFFVLTGIVPAGDLDTLRGECQRAIDAREREMDRLGVNKLDLDRRGSRYFVHAYGKSAASTWRNIRPSRSSARMAHSPRMLAEPLLVDGKCVS